MNWNRKWLISLTILIAALAAGHALLKPAAPVPATATASPATAAIASSSDTLHYPADAAQLAMIRSESLPAVALPVGDTLNARAMYDDDVTARIGVAVSGRVVAIRADVGEHVHAGQVLAEIDAPDYGAALADLRKAQADATRKRLVLERAGALVPGEAIASKDWEAAQADYTQAQAETARAEQRLQSLAPDGKRLSGQRLALTSPVDGVISERNVAPAMDVAPGMSTSLFVITNPHRLWLQLDLPESLLGQIHTGGLVDVESDAYPGAHFQASISQPGQVVDPNSRRVQVRARLNNPDGKLLPEMYVRAALLQQQGRGVKVPNSALVNRGLYTYLFVQVAPDKFQRRAVQMLTHGADTSFLGTGVQGGEKIVTTGALLLDADLNAHAGSAP